MYGISIILCWAEVPTSGGSLTSWHLESSNNQIPIPASQHPYKYWCVMRAQHLLTWPCIEAGPGPWCPAESVTVWRPLHIVHNCILLYCIWFTYLYNKYMCLNPASSWVNPSIQFKPQVRFKPTNQLLKLELNQTTTKLNIKYWMWGSITGSKQGQVC